jgi:tRNA-dihydrouridine synthase B
MQIGPYHIDNPLALAPMVGVTDKFFRRLCRELGAGYVVSEMLAANPSLRDSFTSRMRGDFEGEDSPVVIQIAGSDPAWMADAALYNVARGAQVIDINMGCPAKKVCKVDAGSALLKDRALVKSILLAVVAAVEVPVTLKIRTGWSRAQNNAVEIAQLAEDCGIQALSIHGRSREDRFLGSAEYQTIRQVKRKIQIPVIANGDIDSAKKAEMVMDFTAADAIMVGRIAQQRPWIFGQIDHYLNTGKKPEEPADEQKQAWLVGHLKNLYAFYGEHQGVQIARKHINWQLAHHNSYARVKPLLMQAQTATQQLDTINAYFDDCQWNSYEMAC